MRLYILQKILMALHKKIEVILTGLSLSDIAKTQQYL